MADAQANGAAPSGIITSGITTNGILSNGTVASPADESPPHNTPSPSPGPTNGHTNNHVNGTNGTNGTSTATAAAPAASATPMPIAIIGIACRTSGDVNGPEQLWELCSRARSGWREIPADRYRADAFFHPNPSREGCINPQGGYFLSEDISKFDAPFFNLTEAEAKALDPQQRILLEVVYEAMESAGVPKESLFGKNVGVFMAGSESDYELNNLRDLETAPMYQSTGCHQCMFSNRVSYYFDLRGPSFTVETACSSSLVALHQAIQSLRSGESSQALVGACHLNILPDHFVTMSCQQLLNDTGRAFPFDHRAVGGFARGEGAGCVLLKPLDQAIADNDIIRSVIVNSGLNQDGRTNGITQPNGDAQKELIKSVYANAGLNPADCAFMECHGTGTKVGDPIEVRAVKEILAVGRTPRQPLYIGSIKSNIGHLEGSSGVLSIIKATLMLEKGLVLPNTNYERTNPEIPLAEWNIKVPTSVRPWPRAKKFVSVANYGFGGANAHVVLDKNPLMAAKVNATSYEMSELLDQRVRLYVLSANDKDALKERMTDFSFFLEQRPEVFERALARNIAYTLGCRRSHLTHRVAIPSHSSDDLGVQLASGKVISGRVPPQGVNLAWIFTGQGAQWAKMGVELMEDYPIFRQAIDEADKYLSTIGAEFSLLEELQREADDTKVNLAHISQPICTAIQVALTKLLNSWGIHPLSTTGHSSGSIGAAFAAGILDAESALALAYYRGKVTVSLKQRFPEIQGTMLAVGSGPDTIKPLIKQLKSGYATIACYNSPSSITVSGDVAAIDELQPLIEEKGIFNRKLRVDQAYHSEHMGKVAEEYMSLIEHIKPNPTSTAIYHSSLYGRVAEPAELQPAYWVGNLVSPVLFTEAVASMCSKEATSPTINTLIEVGPHPALEGPTKDILKSLGDHGKKVAYTGCPLVRNKDGAMSALQMAGNVFMKGYKIDFYAINFPKANIRTPTLLTDLPRYPWQHNKEYWHKTRIAEKHRFIKHGRNDILGKMAVYSNELEPTWRNHLRLDDMPWLRQHKMQGMAIFPLSGYLSQAVEAATQRAQDRDIAFDRFEFREVTTSRGLILEEGKTIETVISFRPYTEGLRSYSNVWDEFRICSWNVDKGWTEHCRGLIGVRSGDGSNNVDGSTQIEKARKEIHNKKAEIESSAVENVDVNQMYDNLAEVGADFGPVFRGVTRAKACNVAGFTEMDCADTRQYQPKEYETNVILHPATFDIFFHVVWPITGFGRSPRDTLYLPSSLKHAVISRNLPKDKLYVYGTGDPDNKNPKTTSYDIFAVGGPTSDEALLEVSGFSMTPMRNYDGAGEKIRDLCYKIQWEPAVPAATEDDIKAVNELEAAGVADSQPQDQTMDVKPESAPKVNGDHAPNETSEVPELKPATEDVATVVKDEVVVAYVDSTQSTLASKISQKVEDLLKRHPTTGLLSEVDAAGKLLILIELDKPFLHDISSDMFTKLQNALLNASSVLWCVAGAYQNSDTPNANMGIGVARTVRSETLAKIVTLDVESKTAADATAVAQTITDVLELSWGSQSSPLSTESEFQERNGELQVPRIVPDADMNNFVHRGTQDAAPYLQPFAQEGRRLKLAIGAPGALDTLYFADDQPGPLKPDEVELEVKATGMNFKDVVIAMGQLASPYLGVESSGVVSSVGSNVTDVKVGDRIMAMSEGAYSTYARVKATSVNQISDDMSFEAACTIPVVFCTAYYGLFNVAHVEAGERVLIHAAAGGVGQAAVQLCQMIGAEIFATCGSADKKKFLMDTYNLAEDHIFYSRDTSFGPAIRRATNGEGVDVVLNSLAGDILRETWDCLAHFGRFIEIGKRDITGNTRLEMARFEHNATFASVDLTVVANERPKVMKKLLVDVCRLLKDATLKPITPITTYKISEVEQAIRTLQSGRNTGKLVVVPQPDDQVKATAPRNKSNILPGDASYLIIGGTGGLGRSMAKWMAMKGAKNIVLISRSGQVTEKVGDLMKDLEKIGTKVVVRPCDVGNMDSVKKLINEEIKDLPPIRGVIQSAMVLRDVLYEKMTYEDYAAVVSSKVAGSWNLHNVLSDKPALDFFVCLSSVAGTIGNRGQAAYAAANVFLNAFTQYRNARGMPTVSIDLAAVSNVGYLADNSERAAEVLQNVGGEAVDESEVLTLLEAAITGKMKEYCGSHSITGLHAAPEKFESLFWLSDAKFTYLREAAAAAAGQSGQGGGSIPLSQVLKESSSEEALQLLYEALIAKLSAVLMIPVEDMDPSQPITVYGLDSLVAIEIRNWITREAEANLQVLELLTSSSLMSLARTIMEKSKLTATPPPAKAAE